MKLEKVDFGKTNQFSKIFTDYIDGKNQLKPFYGNAPTIQSFHEQIKSKSFSAEQRKILCRALEDQYQQLTPPSAVSQNIKALAEDKTYTITTGHQLNIFTGPLYFIFKIISVVNTCKILKKQYPDYNFVPVYWMATEDHDFEEISYFRLNGKQIKWKTNQTGAVGRFDPSGLKDIIDKTPGIPDLFKIAYTKSKTLAEAVRLYVNELFGELGLVVIDGDDKSLKQQLKPVILDDLINHKANELVNKQSKKLDELEYNTQVFPRKINFFYLKDNIRSRIVLEKGQYKVLDTDITFSEETIKKEVEEHPDRFSPNVILRPLYEEMILPNLAYVGGPGELAYWFQLNAVFKAYNVAFPILMPRNFALIIASHIKRKMDKANISILDLFKSRHDLLKELVIAHAEKKVEVNGQKATIVDLFDTIKSMANEIDPTLSPHVEAQQTITAHKLDNIQKKFIRAEKRKQSDRMRQAEDILNTLFPNGSLQERTDNFLNFYLANPALIKQLSQYFDPFDFRFNVIVDG